MLLLTIDSFIIALFVKVRENLNSYYLHNKNILFIGKWSRQGITNLLFSDEAVISRIYTIRRMRVMIDRDLAMLYQVETRILNQVVRRNLQRFPDDFMFQLNQVKFENWISQIVISKKAF